MLEGEAMFLLQVKPNKGLVTNVSRAGPQKPFRQSTMTPTNVPDTEGKAENRHGGTLGEPLLLNTWAFTLQMSAHVKEQVLRLLRGPETHFENPLGQVRFFKMSTTNLVQKEICWRQSKGLSALSISGSIV